MDGNNINILHIASGDLWAGAEVQLFTLVTKLSNQQNTRVHVILLNHGALEQKLLEKGIPVTVFDESKLNGFHILRQMIKAVAEIQPDVIHTHRIKENIFGSIAARLNGNTPSLRTAHGAPEHKPAWYHAPKRLILFMDWFCARFLQKKIIAVSQDLANILMKTFPEDKITVIENGIDIDDFTQRDQTTATKKKDPSMRIAIAGRLTPVKRIDIFIKTAQHLKQKHPELNLSFHIYGGGPLSKELKQLSNNLQVEDIVHFEGHCENIRDELEKMDMLLMTSDHEGLPMILLEAMATRLPIIAHAVGGIPNLLDHGNSGILVHKHSAEGYAHKVSELIVKPEECLEIAKRAFNRVTDAYSAEQNAAQYYAEYDNLANY